MLQALPFSTVAQVEPRHQQKAWDNGRKEKHPAYPRQSQYHDRLSTRVHTPAGTIEAFQAIPHFIS